MRTFINFFLMVIIYIIYFNNNAFCINDNMVTCAVSIDINSGQFVFIDRIGGEKLPINCVIQVISTGNNQKIDPPQKDGSPSGDDYIIEVDESTDKIIALEGFFYITGYKFPSSTSIYVRAWNKDTIDKSTKYGNSEIYQTQKDNEIEPVTQTILALSFVTNKNTIISSDLTGDGLININDIILLLKHLSKSK